MVVDQDWVQEDQGVVDEEEEGEAGVVEVEEEAAENIPEIINLTNITRLHYL